MNFIKVNFDDKGKRLDVYLTEKFPDKTRSYFQQNICSGNVFVNGKNVKPSYKLNGNENICVVFEDKIANCVPENLPLNILYEDNDMIVVNKARGMTVHPAANVSTGTLVNALMFHFKNLSAINGSNRPGIVHRLDKDTSGVMVVARNNIAHLNLAEQISQKTATRKYFAIVHGVIADNAGIINGAIGRDSVDRKRMMITPDGKYAVTEFRVLERFSGFTYVECKLQTGRTHQIRVHMAAIGHPLVGDTKYSARKNPFNIQGQALHSHSLTLKQPTTGEVMTFEAPLPDDMTEILNSLRKD